MRNSHDYTTPLSLSKSGHAFLRTHRTRRADAPTRCAALEASRAAQRFLGADGTAPQSAARQPPRALYALVWLRLA